MEYILAKELELEKKLKEIEKEKKQLAKTRGLVNLAEITTPEDLGAAAHERKMKAHERNMRLLQELDLEIGKLHTRRLCPIHERLAEQKSKFLRSIPSSHSQHHQRNL